MFREKNLKHSFLQSFKYCQKQAMTDQLSVVAINLTFKCNNQLVSDRKLAKKVQKCVELHMLSSLLNNDQFVDRTAACLVLCKFQSIFCYSSAFNREIHDIFLALQSSALVFKKHIFICLWLLYGIDLPYRPSPCTIS